MMASAVNAAARRRDQRDGADAERQRRHADERRQQAPDDEADAEEVDLGSHPIADCGLRIADWKLGIVDCGFSIADS